MPRRSTQALRRLGMRLGTLRQFAPRPIRAIRLPPPQSRERLPTLSLVTPSRNMAAYIGDTIRSVLDQNYPNLQYVVMDGGSHDGTAQIIEQYRASLLYYESRQDGGQAAAINSGFRHTSGEIMGWLNADDVLLPGALAFVGAFFRDHPAIDVIYGHRVLIDDNGREVGRWVLPRHDEAAFRWFDFVPQETLFWRRALWEKIGGLDPRFKFAMDWDMLLRMRAAGARFARIPYYLGAFRVHPGQKTSAWVETGNSEIEQLRSQLSQERDWSRRRRRAVAWYVLKHIATSHYYRLRGWA